MHCVATSLVLHALKVALLRCVGFIATSNKILAVFLQVLAVVELQLNTDTVVQVPGAFSVVAEVLDKVEIAVKEVPGSPGFALLEVSDTVVPGLAAVVVVGVPVYIFAIAEVESLAVAVVEDPVVAGTAVVQIPDAAETAALEVPAVPKFNLIKIN